MVNRPGKTGTVPSWQHGTSFQRSNESDSASTIGNGPSLHAEGNNMSKKHFISLAQAFKYNRPNLPLGTYGKLRLSERCKQWNWDVESVASVCVSHNGMFNRSRFITACGGLID